MLNYDTPNKYAQAAGYGHWTVNNMSKKFKIHTSDSIVMPRMVAVFQVIFSSPGRIHEACSNLNLRTAPFGFVNVKFPVNAPGSIY